jgi:hypothetical protein
MPKHREIIMYVKLMFYVFYLVDANSETRQVEGKKNANESQRQLCQQEVVRALPVQR